MKAEEKDKLTNERLLELLREEPCRINLKGVLHHAGVSYMRVANLKRGEVKELRDDELERIQDSITF